uniref:Stress-response A/B barrel domain-containing protein n=2 Tax=Opuntia streptacantha TaxID=393608 RepID=A0A7C8YUL9_OPUST
MSSTSTVEHVVLLNVNDGTDPSNVSSMLDGLNALRSLDMVQYLTTGPVHRIRSTSLRFTHFFHSKYLSKDDLDVYMSQPAHVGLVQSTILRICDDLMVVDWVAPGIPIALGPKPGSAIRVQFVRLKEGLGELEKGEVLEVIGGLKDKVNGIEEFNFGESFSPAYARGFSIAWMEVFPGVSMLDSVRDSVEIVMENDKVKDYVETFLVVDYVLPSSQS